MKPGGLRLRFPNVLRGLHPDCEAVCINTGGGMVGGDTARLRLHGRAGAAVTITTQSAEKIYRAEGRSAHGRRGRTSSWRPVATIGMAAAGDDPLRRGRGCGAGSMSPWRKTPLCCSSKPWCSADWPWARPFAPDHLRDRWRVRRAGRLIFAEDLRLEGEIAGAAGPTRRRAGRARAGHRAFGVPRTRNSGLDAVRAVLAQAPAEAAASAWDGMLTVRALSPSPDRLRATILPLLQVLRGRAAPRVWQ